MLIIVLISGFLALGLIFLGSREFLHILQLSGYNSDAYATWINEKKSRAFGLRIKRQEEKKPLIYTYRVKRLIGAHLIINGLILLPIILKVRRFIRPGHPYFFALAILLFLMFCFLLYMFRSMTLLLANLLILPLEERIKAGFYREAQAKIGSREDLLVVGVTGSFGKTSTKFILGTILGEKYKVLNTPESYNTPMGLSKVINNDLTDQHEVFIAELGARNIGDIRELAQLVKPKIGVLTSIGPTHIETFKNIDNIMKTKYELIEELPADGIAVFNYDNEYIRKISDKTFKEKLLYGMKDKEELDLYAEDIEVSEFGSSFKIKDREGQEIHCTTKLLGKHNIYNILAGVAVARELGLSLEEIKRGIEKIEPIAHRLNIINPGTGIIVIDDAFNSNPIGAKAALEVLGQFKEGRKIIVTPGMIELGAMEESANRELGQNIGKVCDFVILIGEKRTRPIYEGLQEANYNEDHIFLVKNLQEAGEIIQKIARPKDIILFENDLPDNYSE